MAVGDAPSYADRHREVASLKRELAEAREREAADTREKGAFGARVGAPQPRPERGAGAAGRDERDLAHHRPLAGRSAAGPRRHRRKRGAIVRREWRAHRAGRWRDAARSGQLRDLRRFVLVERHGRRQGPATRPRLGERRGRARPRDDPHPRHRGHRDGDVTLDKPLRPAGGGCSTRPSGPPAAAILRGTTRMLAATSPPGPRPAALSPAGRSGRGNPMEAERGR